MRGVDLISPRYLLGVISEAGGVENEIPPVVRRLRQQSVARTFLSIQFICFGQDSEGIRRLRWLDNDAKHTMDGWDIVDAIVYNGDVRKMFIGIKNVDVDNVEDWSSSADSSHTDTGRER
ncbi:hypothetical protein F4679DRAFT_562241 [Xylaria curta]|nr:hypothetical protein F4679DRAFT_562241 [Xylaria curta]